MTPRTDFILILAACVLAMTAKIALLLTSQNALDGDEAIPGLMAIHVRDGLSHPVFDRHYGGGCGMDSSRRCLCGSTSSATSGWQRFFWQRCAGRPPHRLGPPSPSG